MTRFLYNIFLVLLIICSVYSIHKAYLLLLFLIKRRRVPEKAGKKIRRLPFITIQLPVYNEKYVISRLLKSVCSIDYPKNKYEIQVLDDSTDSTTRIIRKETASFRKKGFNIKLVHRNNREGFKAGALNEGLQSAKGEFIFILDSDFLPPKNIIRALLGSFGNPEVGMVQARWGHLNREYSLLTEAQSMLLDSIFCIEHNARYLSGRFFNFNGTAGMWRKRAIFDSGGWEADTLTEDMDLSYRAQMRGWKFVYNFDVVCLAELPVEMGALKTQQSRWTKGAIQTAMKILPSIWKSRLPLKLKVESTLHLSENLMFIFLVMFSVLLGPVMVYRHASGSGIRYFSDFALILANLLFYLFYFSVLNSCSAPAGEKGKGFYKYARRMLASAALGIGLSVNNGIAAISAFLPGRQDFRRTAKYGIINKGEQWKSKAYYQKLGWGVFLLEMLLMAYFIFINFKIYQWKMYAMFPLTLVFLAGYAYVGAVSFYERLK